MEDLDFPSSDGNHRYSQHSTSFDSADCRSNSMSESTGANADWFGSCSSYVRVEHSDSGITGGSFRAVNSWCSDEQPELQADLADQNLQQQPPGYPHRQNSLWANQFDYTQSSTSAYDLQSEVAPLSDDNDQREYWARRSEPDYFARPSPISTLDAEYNDDSFHLRYSVQNTLNDQGQVLPDSGMSYDTQPAYPEDFRDDHRPYYTGHTQESNNSVCSHQHPVAEDGNGPWSTVNPQNNCQRHLEQKTDRLLDVINARHTISDSTWASNSFSSSHYGSNEQQWGEASEATVRPSGDQQSHRDDYSNDPRHPLPAQHQAGFPMSRDLAMMQTGTRPLPIRTGPPSMRYVSMVSHPPPLTCTNSSRSLGNNRRPRTPALATSASPSSVQSNMVRCPSCSAQFEGIHRQGNYGRHRRQKHAGQRKELPCEHSTCGKSYRRSDARLKHYRKYHPELIGGAV
ncbi:hypothetical protein IG631_16005 [Alternaria alternata]|nr:hypothetical protein IG631_16005 [Alternaria alternata]